MSEISKHNWFGPFTFDYLESWYQDLARDGLILKESSGVSSIFERSSPTELRYRVIPKNVQDISEEELSLYESAGWKYIPTEASMSIFCNDDMDAPELYTDDGSWRQSFRKTVNTNILSLIFGLIIVGRLIIGYEWFSIDLSEGLLWPLMYLIGNIGILAGLIFSVKGWVLDSLRFNRLMKDYASVDHNIPYQWELSFRRALLIICLSGMGIAFLMLILPF